MQAKGSESWVNVSNLTTITPITKEPPPSCNCARRPTSSATARSEISDAIDAYAAKNNLPPDATFKWPDIRKFLKPDTPVYDSDGKDVTGRPYIFGKIADGVKVSPETIKELSVVIDDPDDVLG